MTRKKPLVPPGVTFRKLIASAAVAALFIGSSHLTSAATPAEVVVDFEQADVGKSIPTWTEKNVIFTLSRPPAQSKAVGRVTFFPHLATERKGILCAMATEPIPVQAKFPQPVSSVTVKFWASTGCPVLLEACDKDGKVLDQAALAAAPSRSAPAEPVPFFELTVKAAEIASIRFSGPRAGEFLAADEVRFTPAAKPAN